MQYNAPVLTEVNWNFAIDSEGTGINCILKTVSPCDEVLVDLYLACTLQQGHSILPTPCLLLSSVSFHYSCVLLCLPALREPPFSDMAGVLSPASSPSSKLPLTV